MTVQVFLFFIALSASSVSSQADNDVLTKTVHSFQVENTDGELISFEEYKGKMLLIVNVASECGYTDAQYEGLVQLQSELGFDHFQVLAFPCNDFGQQEPLPAKDVRAFVEKEYGVNFPIFQKVNIATGEISPLFKYLQDRTGESVSWNFYKFLVGFDGEPISAWGPSTSVESLTSDIRDRIFLHTRRPGQHRGSRSEF